MSTRSESLEITRETAATRRQQILDALFMSPPLSRSELAAKTGMRLSSVCGRVNELLDEGRIVVDGTTYDPATQRHVETLTIS